jgi:hypothetical protein
LTNFSKEEIVVPKSTGVGMAEEISEALVATINPEPSAQASRKVEINPEFREYVGEKLAHLSEEDKRVMEPVLLRYRVCSMTRRGTILGELIWPNTASSLGTPNPFVGPSIGRRTRCGRRWIDR